jgi:hypothetical protein
LIAHGLQSCAGAAGSVRVSLDGPRSRGCTASFGKRAPEVLFAPGLPRPSLLTAETPQPTETAFLFAHSAFSALSAVKPSALASSHRQERGARPEVLSRRPAPRSWRCNVLSPVHAPLPKGHGGRLLHDCGSHVEAPARALLEVPLGELPRCPFEGCPHPEPRSWTAACIICTLPERAGRSLDVLGGDASAGRWTIRSRIAVALAGDGDETLPRRTAVRLMMLVHPGVIPGWARVCPVSGGWSAAAAREAARSVARGPRVLDSGQVGRGLLVAGGGGLTGRAPVSS